MVTRSDGDASGEHETERWRPTGEAWLLDGNDAAECLSPLRSVPGEIWLESSRRRSLAVVSNGSRAMLMLLDESGDPGVHAADPSAPRETMGGFLLSNGQVDEYSAQDTIPVDIAISCIQSLVTYGVLPSSIIWINDRVQGGRITGREASNCRVCEQRVWDAFGGLRPRASAWRVLEVIRGCV